MKCLFFPYAGSFPNNPVCLSEVWKKNRIEIKSICYWGYEKFQWDEFLQSITKQISQFVGDDNYFIWGHSMGSCIAYEIYFMLLKGNYKLPKHIYFSAGIPPHKIEKDLLKMNDEELEEVFVRLGGIPKRIRNSEMWLNYTMQFIIQDIRLLSKYTYQRHLEPILCSTTVLFGKEDKFYNYMLTWKELLFDNHNVVFDGDHFFLFNKMEELSKLFIADIES